MLDSSDFKIRGQLADYVAGKISRRQFVDWFFAETSDIDERDNQALANLVYSIKLRLAEFSHGDWTEAELRNMLLFDRDAHRRSESGGPHWVWR